MNDTLRREKMNSLAESLGLLKNDFEKKDRESLEKEGGQEIENIANEYLNIYRELESPTNEDKRTLALYQSELAYVYYKQDDFSKAKEFYRKSIKTFKSIDSVLSDQDKDTFGQCYDFLGEIYGELREADEDTESREFIEAQLREEKAYRKAIAVWETKTNSTDMDRRNLSERCFTLANAYYRGEYLYDLRGEDYFLKSIQAREGISVLTQEDKAYIALRYVNLAEFYIKQSVENETYYLKKAQKKYLKAIQILEKKELEESYRSSCAQVYMRLGKARLYLGESHVDEAKKNFQTGVKLILLSDRDSRLSVDFGKKNETVLCSAYSSIMEFFKCSEIEKSFYKLAINILENYKAIADIKYLKERIKIIRSFTGKDLGIRITNILKDYKIISEGSFKELSALNEALSAANNRESYLLADSQLFALFLLKNFRCYNDAEKKETLQALEDLSQRIIKSQANVNNQGSNSVGLSSADQGMKIAALNETLELAKQKSPSMAANDSSRESLLFNTININNNNNTDSGNNKNNKRPGDEDEDEEGRKSKRICLGKKE